MKNAPNREILKSTLIGIAALAALVSWLALQPRLPDQEPREKIGKKIFDNFNDLSKMTRIEFKGIDPETGELRELLLTKDGQEWRLPSLSGFPAENAERLSKVVAPLTQLSILDVVDETTKTLDSHKIAEFHRECGLVNPTNYDVEQSLDDDLKTEATKVDDAALHVRIDGEGGENLLDLLIGKRAPESSMTRDDRFVRLPNEEVVYTADFEGDSTQETSAAEFAEYPSRISFEPIDWVDRDLLRISRWDVLFLAARDYRFSVQRSENEIGVANYRTSGIAVFRQTPENSISRVWSLDRRFIRDEDGSWRENEKPDPESANNESLNALADELAKLSIVDVRKKPAALAALFHADRFGTQLTPFVESLADFGFTLTDYDPLLPERIEPSLVGEGGAVELTMKTGVQISLLFGRKFEEKRAVLAYASYSRDALAASVEDESEIEFLEPEAKQKASLKNNRFADWFYLIDEADYEKIRTRISDTLK